MRVALSVLPLAEPVSFRFDERDLRNLARIRQLLGCSRRQAVSEALVHLRATLERGDPTYRVVPGEAQDAPEEEGA